MLYSMKRCVLGFAAAAALAIPVAPSVHAAGCVVVPPEQYVFGKSLSQWIGDYFRWSYTGGGGAVYQPGLAPVVFMPLPAGEYISGAGTADDPALLVGNIDVTLDRFHCFVLPFWAWVSETYDPALNIPDDIPIDNSVVGNVVTEWSLTVDKESPIPNIWDYYVGPEPYDPAVMYPVASSYGSVGAIAYQGAGAVFYPLRPGLHRLHLRIRLRLTGTELPMYGEGFSAGVIYDNTWNIRIAP